MNDPVGQIVCGVVAIALTWLTIDAIQTGTVYGRGVKHTRTGDPVMFRATVVIQIGFTIFLVLNAAGLHPWAQLRALLSGLI